jgi:hypothetical protein
MGKSLFSSVDPQKISVGANYMKAGEYWARIDKTLVTKNRKGEDIAVIETTIVRTFGECQNRVGETVAKVVKEKGDYFFNDTAAFACAMLGENPKSMSKADLEELLAGTFEAADGRGPFTGLVVHVVATDTKTKTGGDFTRIDWKGEVNPNKVIETLKPEDVSRFWPNGELAVFASKPEYQAA